MAGACSETGCQLLLVEDDLKLGELVSRFLQENGYAVHWARTAAEAWKFSQQQLSELVICDLMLPDEHGFTLFDRIRRDSDVPFLFLTAIGDTDTHIEGIERGAVDYLIKPVDPLVLLARIRAQLRRQQKQEAPVRHITLAPLSIDAGSRLAIANGTALDLTRQEFELLWLLAQYPNTILNRDVLFGAVTGRPYDGKDRIIDGRVSRLRRKLEAVDGNPWTIRPVWGRGYLFCKGNPTTG